MVWYGMVWYGMCLNTVIFIGKVPNGIFLDYASDICWVLEFIGCICDVNKLNL